LRRTSELKHVDMDASDGADDCTSDESCGSAGPTFEIGVVLEAPGSESDSDSVSARSAHATLETLRTDAGVAINVSLFELGVGVGAGVGKTQAASSEARGTTSPPSDAT